MRTFHLLLCALFLPLLTVAADAQSLDSLQPRSGIAVSLGGIASWHNSAPLGGARQHEIERADLFGFGFMAGVAGSHRLGRRISLRGELDYLREHLSTSITTTIQTRIRTFEDENSPPPTPPEPALVLVTATSDLDLIRLSLVGLFDVVQVDDANLSLLAGPAFSLVVGEQQYETVDLDPIRPNVRFRNPDNVPTEDNGRRLIAFGSNFESSPALASPSTRPGVIVGAQFQIRPSGEFSIVSSVEHEIPLTFITDPNGEEGSRSLFFKTGVQWHFEW